MKKQLPAWLALCIIALAAGLMLAITNHLTAGRIKEQALIKANEARMKVLPQASEFTPHEIDDERSAKYPVDDCYEGMDEAGNPVGYTSQTTVKGYGGPIEVVVGMDLSGSVTGISVGGSGFAETAGLGARTREEAFTSQFAGMTPPLALKEDVDSVTGASISSGAVVSGVNQAVSYMRVEAGLDAFDAGPIPEGG